MDGGREREKERAGSITARSQQPHHEHEQRQTQDAVGVCGPQEHDGIDDAEVGRARRQNEEGGVQKERRTHPRKSVYTNIESAWKADHPEQAAQDQRELNL